MQYLCKSVYVFSVSINNLIFLRLWGYRDDKEYVIKRIKLFIKLKICESICIQLHSVYISVTLVFPEENALINFQFTILALQRIVWYVYISLN